MDPIVIETGTTGRRRARTLDAARIEGHAPDGKWHADAFTGGTVPNAYRYPATTDACLVVTDPEGRVVIWLAHGQLSANKATSRGAARVCLPGSEAIFDKRLPRRREGDKAHPARIEAWQVICQAHRLELLRSTKTGDLIDRCGVDLESLPAEVIEANLPTGEVTSC